MNFLSLFVVIPVLMLLALLFCRSIKQVHAVAVTGASAVLATAIYLLVSFLSDRAAGADAPMLYTDSILWFAPLNIHYAIGVDGISVAMLMLSAIILFTGVFASWTIKDQTKEYYMWLVLLSLGVFGFFI